MAGVIDSHDNLISRFNLLLISPFKLRMSIDIYEYFAQRQHKTTAKNLGSFRFNLMPIILLCCAVFYNEHFKSDLLKASINSFRSLEILM